MALPLALSIAYVLLAALLLTITISAYRKDNMRSRLAKIALIIIVTAFYIFAYRGAHNLRGWAHQGQPPNPFKLHWAVVEEPDKTQGNSGAIYILAQRQSIFGGLLSQPRLYQMPFSISLAREVSAAQKSIENGEPITARLAMRAPKGETLKNPSRQDGTSANPDSRGENLHLEFQPLAPPALPAKPPIAP